MASNDLDERDARENLWASGLADEDVLRLFKRALVERCLRTGVCAECAWAIANRTVGYLDATTRTVAELCDDCGPRLADEEW